MNARHAGPGLIVASTVLLCVACGGSSNGGTPSETDLEIAIVDAFPALTFNQPLALASAPGDDDHLWVATRRGEIFRFRNSAQTPSATLALDLRGRTDASGDEQGLLGFAFDPDYADNGRLYTNRTVDDDDSTSGSDATLISRFGPGDAGPLASETRLLEFTQPYENHNGGWLGFGRDGLLYIASGDGGSGGDPENRAQNLDSLLGKILRIRPDGGIPDGNPFAGDAGRRGEIWAYGLRNPFRSSFDRQTGEL